MFFNMCLCYLKLDRWEEAVSVCKEIDIKQNEPSYRELLIFKGLIQGDQEMKGKWGKLRNKEVYPIKNKLSNFLEPFEVALPEQQREDLRET